MTILKIPLFKKRRHETANLKIVPLKNETSKKQRLQAGLKKQKRSLIVTTDADCGVRHDWVQTIVDFYPDNNSSFIAAPVSIAIIILVEIFQALDFITLRALPPQVCMQTNTLCVTV